MKILCPYCGGEIEFELIEVSSGGLFTLCPHCTNQLRIQQREDKFFVIYTDATGKERNEPAKVLGASAATVDGGFKISEDGGSLLELDDSAKRKGNTAKLDSWGVITDEKEATGISKPNISETEIRRVTSMPPPEPAQPSKHSEVIEEHIAPGGAKPTKAQPEVVPPTSGGATMPYGAAQSQQTDDSSGAHITLVKRKEPSGARMESIRHASSASARRMAPQRKSGIKTLLIAGGILVLAVAVVIGIMWLFSGKKGANSGNTKYTLSVYPDYQNLVAKLKQTHPHPKQAPQYLIEEARKKFLSSIRPVNQDALRLLGEAVAQRPDMLRAISWYTIVRMWTLTPPAPIEVKQLKDGLEFASQTNTKPQPEAMLAEALIQSYLNEYMKARNLAESACSMPNAPAVVCNLVKGLIYLSAEPHRSLQELGPLAASGKKFPAFVYYLLGDAYRQTLQYAKAEAMFLHYLQQAPKSGMATYALARLYADIGMFDKAFEYINKCMEFDSVRVAAAILAAQTQRNYNLKGFNASKLIDDIVFKGFGSASARQVSRMFTENALLLVHEGKVQEAVRNLKRAQNHLKKDEMRTVLSYCSGLESVSVSGMFDEFQEAVSFVLDDYPNDDMLKLVEAFGYYDAGLIKDAATKYKMLAASGSKLAALQIAQAVLHLEANQISEGFRFLKELKFKPLLPTLWKYEASPFFAPEKLWKRIQSALISDSVQSRDSYNAAIYLGLSAFWLNHYKQAAKELANIWNGLGIGAHTSPATIGLPLAWSLIQTHKPKQAREVLRRLLKLVPKQPVAQMMLGYTFELEGNDAKAMKAYQQVVSSGADQKYLYLPLLRLKLKQGSFTPNDEEKLRNWKTTMKDNLLWRNCHYRLQKLKQRP